MMTIPPEVPPIPPGWLVHPLAAGITAMVVEKPPPLTPALIAEIEAHWLAAQAASGGALFNGTVFSVDMITGACLSGHMTEYRRVLAQFRDPGLFDILKLRPLAVCGVLVSPDGVVLGRRHGGAVYQSGMWQTPPAGNVDGRAVRPDGEIDFLGQLFAELREEIGLSRDTITATRPLALVEHAQTHVLDLGFELSTRLGAGAIIAAHAGAGNDEYERLRLVAVADLPGFLARVGPEMVPSVPILLHAAGLIGAC